MSYIHDVKHQAQLQTDIICRFLNWDKLMYGEFQYRHGCEYLQLYIPTDPGGIDEMLQSKLYWSWWKNQWQQRDQVYLVNLARFFSVLPVDDLRAIYNLNHDVRILARELTPNKFVLNFKKAVA